MTLAAGRSEGVCEARECDRPATLRISWRNPKIPWVAEKVWLSCDEHRDLLADYMRYRGFPFTIAPLEEDGASAAQEGG